MPIKPQSMKWDKLVSSQISLWEFRKKLEEKQPHKDAENPWHKAHITISRSYGAKGFEIAKMLGRKLHWEVYSRNLVEYISETSNVRNKLVETFDEKTKNEIQNWVHTLLDSQVMTTDKYFKHLASVLMTIEEHGQAIVVGRGANFLFNHEIGLHVRITASLEWRVAHVAEKWGISEKDAKKLVNKHDSDRLAFIRRYYQRDANDPTAYDLVINIERLTLEKVADIILSALEIRLGRPRPEKEEREDSGQPDHPRED
ncbi:MAG: cytidylate kinase-like family protein [Calditrichaeota bacterium]|nr:cytidylate kinase-like family protein [Calditrichota bacterium]